MKLFKDLYYSLKRIVSVLSRLKGPSTLNLMASQSILGFTKLVTNRAVVPIIVREVLGLQVEPCIGQVTTYFFTKNASVSF